MVKKWILPIVLLILPANILVSQDTAVSPDDDQYHKVYRGNKLSVIRDHSSGNNYSVSWREGEVEIVCLKTKGQVIIYKNETTVKYDNLFRICEIRSICEYGNHSSSVYLGMKYHGMDTTPSRCYHYSQYGIDPPEISETCSYESLFYDIIDTELKTRSKYYRNGSIITDYDPPCGSEDLNNPDSGIYRFLQTE